MTKLKPCPFCGSKRVKEYIKLPRRGIMCRKGYFHIYIYCQDCNTYGPRVLLADDSNIKNKIEKAREKVIELWNNRIGD